MPRAARLLAALPIVLAANAGCDRHADADPSETSKTLLGVGADLPNVEGVDQEGKTHRLSESQGHPTVVYFYPKDGSPGCTKEACAFRDVWNRYTQQGVAIYGVSRDDQKSHEHFAREHRIPFPLIADPDGKWVSAFGVPANNGKLARVSFLFDKNGRLTRTYPNVDPGVHADQVLEDVAALK